MKALCLFGLGSLLCWHAVCAQGTLQFSNLGLEGRVSTYFPGEAIEGKVEVSLALPDSTLLGSPTSVSAAGFFSGGVRTLEGLTGEVTLAVAGWRKDLPWLIAISDPFVVSLGDSMANAATIPSDFSGLKVLPIPEPTTQALLILAVLACSWRLRTVAT